MNSTKQIPIDVFFRAERYYIQGSLMISECYDAAREYLESAVGSENIVLKEVGFRAFLDSAACILPESSATETERNNSLGYADFAVADNPKEKKRLLFMRDKDKVVPRHEDSEKVIRNFKRLSETSFECDFSSTPSNLVDGFFRGVIEITKKSHTLAFPGCSDILFIGLRKWAFPISNQILLNQHGKHHLQIGSSMTKDGRGMTVSRLTTTLASGETFKGGITFSFAEAGSTS